MTKHRIVDIGTSVSMEDLRRIEVEHPRIHKGLPSELALEDIYVANNVFQWRFSGANIAALEEHTKVLMRVLEDHGKPLDPIVVTQIGDRFYVIDGHHRVQAYRSVKWSSMVPV